MEITSLPTVLAFATLTGITSGYLAKQRNRNPLGWFFAGVTMGVIGLLILALLPAKPANHVNVASVPAPSGSGDLFPSSESAPERISQPIERLSSSRDIHWYYIDENAKQQGPFKFKEFKQHYLDGKFNKKSYIWHEELVDWKILESFGNIELLSDPDLPLG